MDEFEPAVLTELIGRIYEAAADSRHWGEFLALLEQFHPDSRITLFGPEDGRPAESLTVHKNFPAEDLRAYLDYYVTNSPHAARAHQLPVGRAVHGESVIEDREFFQTEHYNDFTRPRRL